MVIEALRRVPNLREIQEKQLVEELGYWKTAVKNAKKSGEITTELPDEVVARMFVNLADGILLHQTLSSKSFEDTLRELKKTYDGLFSLLVSYRPSDKKRIGVTNGSPGFKGKRAGIRFHFFVEAQ